MAVQLRFDVWEKSVTHLLCLLGFDFVFLCEIQCKSKFVIMSQVLNDWPATDVRNRTRLSLTIWRKAHLCEAYPLYFRFMNDRIASRLTSGHFHLHPILIHLDLLQIASAADGFSSTNPAERYVTASTAPTKTTTDASVKADSGFWSQSFDSHRISMAALEGTYFVPVGTDEWFFMIGLNDSQESLCVIFVPAY